MVWLYVPGVGMLDEGLRAGLEFLGARYRTVCYVERKPMSPASLSRAHGGRLLDEAPIWSDLLTFDGGPWRGVVDCITAGFPCQPHSLAGKRSGLDDERWIWPDITRIIREVSPRLVWLENVPGLVSTGGFACCLEDLSALGFDAEWGVLAAADVGTSHRRERLFILAYRRHEPGRPQQSFSIAECSHAADFGLCGKAMADAARHEWDGQDRQDRCGGEFQKQVEQWATPMAADDGHKGHCCVEDRIDPAGNEMGNARGRRMATKGGPNCRGSRETNSCGTSGIVADACRESRGENSEEHLTNGSGRLHLDQLPNFVRFRFSLPAQPTTDGTTSSPNIRSSPALKPGLRVLADGLAVVVDESEPISFARSEMASYRFRLQLHFVPRCSARRTGIETGTQHELLRTPHRRLRPGDCPPFLCRGRGLQPADPQSITPKRNRCPATSRPMQRLVGARTKEERQAVADILDEFFEQEADGWHNKRCDAEIAGYRGKRDKARASAEARWSKRNAPAMRTHSETDANASTGNDADAMRTHSERNAHQAPSTRHQTQTVNKRRQ